MSDAETFLDRLRERQVIKTLVLYVAIGWGFYEIASEVLTRFGFRDSWITLLLIFLLLGLPAALFLAWYFDVDRRGIHKEASLSGGDKAIIIASLLLPVVGVFVAKPMVEESSAVADLEANTVAVLPFANYTGDAELEYLGDGVAEEVIAALTGLGAFDVSALTQSFRFRGADTGATEIGRELDVAWIVRGSVRSSGQLLRFTASLIDARSDATAWSESLEVSKLAVFRGQDELSRAVAGALASEVGVEVREIVAADAPDPEAYDLYLRGRHIWHRRGTVDIGPGIRMLAEATRIDPEFAKGWAALASGYLTWPSYSPEGYGTWYSSEDVALKAVELDPNLPEPYAVLASHAQSRREWLLAQDFFMESLRLAPNNATANFWYGELLSSTGRFADSIRHMQRAVELDPTYEAPKMNIAFGIMTMGATNLGATRLADLWSSGFRSPINWMGNFIALVVTGRIDEARQWVNDSPMPDDGKAIVQRFLDNEEGLQDPDLAEDLYNAPTSAIVYQFKLWLLARLGAHDQLFEYINLRLERDDFLDTRPLWGIGYRLYENPDFPALMQRLGLVEYWQVNGWGDVCRPEGESFVCDGHGLTADAATAALETAH